MKSRNDRLKVQVLPCFDVAQNPGGLFTAINLLHSFRPVGTYPIVVPYFAVLTWWSSEAMTPENVSAAVQVLPPEGEEPVAEALFDFSVGGGVFTHIHVSLFRDVVLEKPGVYRLVVLADGFPVESIPLLAEEVKTEEVNA